MVKGNETLKTINVRLTPEIHKELKIYLFEKDMSIQSFLEGLILKELKKAGKISEKTKSAGTAEPVKNEELPFPD